MEYLVNTEIGTRATMLIPFDIDADGRMDIIV